MYLNRSPDVCLWLDCVMLYVFEVVTNALCKVSGNGLSPVVERPGKLSMEWSFFLCSRLFNWQCLYGTIYACRWTTLNMEARFSYIKKFGTTNGKTRPGAGTHRPSFHDTSLPQSVLVYCGRWSRPRTWSWTAVALRHLFLHHRSGNFSYSIVLMTDFTQVPLIMPFKILTWTVLTVTLGPTINISNGLAPQDWNYTVEIAYSFRILFHWSAEVIAGYTTCLWAIYHSSNYLENCIPRCHKPLHKLEGIWLISYFPVQIGSLSR